MIKMYHSWTIICMYWCQ